MAEKRILVAGYARPQNHVIRINGIDIPMVLGGVGSVGPTGEMVTANTVHGAARRHEMRIDHRHIGKCAGGTDLCSDAVAALCTGVAHKADVGFAVVRMCVGIVSVWLDRCKCTDGPVGDMSE